MCWFCFDGEAPPSDADAAARVYKPVPRQGGWLMNDRYAAWPSAQPPQGDDTAPPSSSAAENTTKPSGKGQLET